MKREVTGERVQLRGLVLVVNEVERAHVLEAIAQLDLKGTWAVAGYAVGRYQDNSECLTPADLWTWTADGESDALLLQSWMDAKAG